MICTSRAAAALAAALLVSGSLAAQDTTRVQIQNIPNVDWDAGRVDGQAPAGVVED